MLEVVSAVIVRNCRILLTQRGVQSDYAWRWETPGGKVERGERHTDAVDRELREELGFNGLLAVSRDPWFVAALTTVPKPVRLSFFTVDAGNQSPALQVGVGMGWFTWREFMALELAPGNVAAAHKIRGLLLTCEYEAAQRGHGA